MESRGSLREAMGLPRDQKETHVTVSRGIPMGILIVPAGSHGKTTEFHGPPQGEAEGGGDKDVHIAISAHR